MIAERQAQQLDVGQQKAPHWTRALQIGSYCFPPSIQPSLSLLGLTVLVVCVAECVLAVRVAAVVVLLVVVMVVVDLGGVGRLILFGAELVRGRSAEGITADEPRRHTPKTQAASALRLSKTVKTGGVGGNGEALQLWQFYAFIFT